jgi:K+-sensing histidine kinase KdpD
VKNDLFGIYVYFADPLINKVFYNLINKAVRHSGKIMTIFAVGERDRDHNKICEDDGEGIARDEKEQIFDQGFGKNAGLTSISKIILWI